MMVVNVAKLPSYREAFKRRRCLIPASAFFAKGHYFQLTADKPFAFAGLWETWGDGEDVVESCTLITTEPNCELRSVGHDRMPVLLTSEDEYLTRKEVIERLTDEVQGSIHDRIDTMIKDDLLRLDGLDDSFGQIRFLKGIIENGGPKH